MKWLLLLLTACGARTEVYPSEPKAQALRDTLEAFDPSFKDLSQTSDSAKRVMDFVFKNTKLQRTNKDFHLVTPAENLNQILTNHDNWGHICGGLAITMSDILYAYGFEVRRVGLFSAGIDTHAVLEAYIEGKWLSFDPTYNSYYTDASGEHISFQEFKEITEAHELYLVQYIGRDPDRTVEAYPVPYSAYFYRIEYREIADRFNP